MTWKSGKIHTRNGRRGRFWYWKGSKATKKFRTLNSGKPKRAPKSRR